MTTVATVPVPGPGPSPTPGAVKQCEVVHSTSDSPVYTSPSPPPTRPFTSVEPEQAGETQELHPHQQPRPEP